MKKKLQKFLLQFGAHTVKLNIDNPVTARSGTIVPAVNMDMLAVETGQPVNVQLKNVAWLLAEGTEKNGRKFQYLVGLPVKEGG